MKLTNSQTRVLHSVVSDIRAGKNKVSLGGYAGTGKTTLVKYLTKFFPAYGVCAYTGKAANVLRKKSIPATTIHGRIYKPYFDNGAVYWDLTDDPGCDGFIVDEASMVSTEIFEDLASFGLPLVFVGDHGQLPPIESELNLMESPDYVLEEIHRNAGEIARFAEHLRKGYAARSFRGQEGIVEFLSQRDLTNQNLTDCDQVICAYNRTRVTINERIREAFGHKGLLNVGERVMCLRNNRQQGLFNGMQGIVRNLYVYRRGTYMDFEFDGEMIEGIRYEARQFGKEKYDIQHGKDTPNPFDYAYCITAHKSQGDEWDNVLVIEQKCNKWSHKRWAYTTASRAKGRLRWLMAA